MATVSDLLQFIESLAPRAMKMDWDNVGLLCGSRNTLVQRVLVALDPFEGVCQEAAAWGADVIVTHHPLIFQPLHSVTDDTSIGRSIGLLYRHGISAINAHTNLDCTPDGVNDQLAAKLGLTQIAVVNPQGVDASGREWGLLRQGLVEEQPLSAFLSTVKENLRCPGLRYVDAGKTVHRVAVGGGACASELKDAFRAGCDTFVTADVKYNQFWDARDMGINLIDAGHFYTENPVTYWLAEKISAAFPALHVKISETHQDCMKFY